MALHPIHHKLRNGMTLVELMIVAVVLAILAAMAWPSFQQAVQRSRRADAMSALAEIMQAQERWRANNPSYQGVLASLPGARAVSQNGHYGLALTVESATAGVAYIASATVRSGSPQAGDSRCQVLQVSMTGGNIVYGSLASGSVANVAPDPCWVR